MAIKITKALEAALRKAKNQMVAEGFNALPKAKVDLAKSLGWKEGVVCGATGDGDPYCGGETPNVTCHEGLLWVITDSEILPYMDKRQGFEAFQQPCQRCGGWGAKREEDGTIREPINGEGKKSAKHFLYCLGGDVWKKDPIDETFSRRDRLRYTNVGEGEQAQIDVHFRMEGYDVLPADASQPSVAPVPKENQVAKAAAVTKKVSGRRSLINKQGS